MVNKWTEHDILSSLSRIGKIAKHNHDEILLKECPYCGKNDSKFSVNIEKQVFRCLHVNSCNKTGTLYKLFSDKNVLPQTGKKAFTRPKPDPAIVSPDDFYNRYHKERGISPDVLKKYQVGCKNENGTELIVYSYFNEKKELINRKFRSSDKSYFRTEKDAEHTYYGIDHLDFNEKKLMVVAGEDDCHALIQEGFKNVVSVPYGDGNYTDGMHAINERFPEIVLMFDADLSGQAGALKFAQKAGIHKCKNVILPFKDARDCVLNGVGYFPLMQEIEQAQRFKLPGAWNIEELSPLRYAVEPPPVEWIIIGVLAKGLAGYIYGEGGTFKSLLMLAYVIQRACAHIYAGQTWLKFSVTPGKSIFFSAEDVDLDFHIRFYSLVKIIAAQRPDIPEAKFFEEISNNLLIVPREKWVQDGTQFLLDKDGNETTKVQNVINLVNEFDADLVILETSSRMYNTDENDNQMNALVVGVMEKIRDQTFSTVLTIAHSNKVGRSIQTDVHGQNGLRGGSAQMDNGRFGMQFRAQPSEDGHDIIEVVNSKAFRCKRFEPFKIIITDYPRYEIYTEANKDELREQLFEQHKDGLLKIISDNPGISRDRAATQAGGKKEHVLQVIDMLLNKNLIVNKSEGVRTKLYVVPIDKLESFRNETERSGNETKDGISKKDAA